MNRLADIIAQTLSARETICLNQCVTKSDISDPACLAILEDLRLVSQLRDTAASQTGFHNLTPLGVEVVALLRRAPNSNIIRITRTNAAG